MTTSNIIDFFEELFWDFWDILFNMRITSSLSFGHLFVSFIFFAVIWGFVFRKVIKTGD